MTAVQPYLTAAEAAARLTAGGVPVSEDTVRRWGRSGRIPAIKLPFGRQKFSAQDIDALLVPTKDVA